MTRVGLSRDAKHRYTATYDGVAVVVPGVTGILGVLNKPAIVPWAQRIVAEAAIAHRADLEGWVAVGGVDGAVGLLKQAAETKRDRAASIGSEVHALAEAIVKGQPVIVPAELAGFVDAYRDWMVRFEPTFLAVEEMVYGDGYGGTFDSIAVIAGETWLLDVKTSAGTYRETGLQLAAYGRASFIGRPDDPQKYAIPAIDQYGVVHVRPEGAELVPYDVGDAEYETFLAAKRVHRWMDNEGKTVVGQPIGPALLAFTKEEKTA